MLVGGYNYQCYQQYYYLTSENLDFVYVTLNKKHRNQGKEFVITATPVLFQTCVYECQVLFPPTNNRVQVKESFSTTIKTNLLILLLRTLRIIVFLPLISSPREGNFFLITLNMNPLLSVSISPAIGLPYPPHYTFRLAESCSLPNAIDCQLCLVCLEQFTLSTTLFSLYFFPSLHLDASLCWLSSFSISISLSITFTFYCMTNSPKS